MLSRRNFLKSSASLIAIAAMRPVEAAFHGSPANSKVTVNYNGSQYNNAFLNIAKYIQPFNSAMVGWPSIMSGSGEYPNGTFTSQCTSQVLLDPVYYGHYVISWSGTASLGGIGGNPTIIYNGGAFVSGLGGANTGETAGNMFVTGAGANVEFAFGVLIGSVSTSGAGDHGGAGLVKFTTKNTGRAGNFQDGMTFKFNNLSGLPAGPNSDGSWSIFAIDVNNFSLQGSAAFAGSVSITGAGAPGVETEGIYSTSTSSANLSGTYTSFSNLLWYQLSDQADILAGKLVGTAIAAAFAGTKAAFIRFMDLLQIQNISLPAYAQRVQSSDFSWGTNINKFAYWGGVMTNSSDVFTVPTNPSASPASGAYVDGETIVAQVPSGGHNTTQTPSMGITGRTGTAPIFNKRCSLLNLTLGGSVPPSGTTLSLTFNGAGLSSFTYNYVTSTTVNGPGGVTDTSLQNIIFNIRADLQNNTRGNAGPFVSAGWYCQNQDYPVAGHGLSWNDSQAAFYYNPNINATGTVSLNAGATITGNDPTSNVTFTFGFVPNGGTGYLADLSICTFTYSKLLGGWICTPGSLDQNATPSLGGGPPLEWCAELCARANAGMWLNIGIFDTATTIFDKVQLLAQLTYNGKPAVKQLAIEWGNETWNNGLALWTPCRTTAASLGIPIAGNGNADYSSHALRTLQMAQQATSAWAAAGRARSDLKIVNAYWFIAPLGDASATTSTTAVSRFNGAALNASGTGTNATLKAFGGAGATAITTDFSSAPNRPIDWCDWISPATYWTGSQDNFNITGGSSGGTISNYNGLMLAAYNYAYGTPTQQQAALDFLYSISGNTGDLYDGPLFAGDDAGTQISAWVIGGSNQFKADYCGLGVLVSSYDTSRSTTGTSGGAQTVLGVGCYEGGWQNGPSSLTQISGTLTGLGYTNGYSSSLPGAASGGPTGASDTATLAAENVFYLLYGGNPANGGLAGWKNDNRAFALVTQQFNQFKASATKNGARDAYAAWYGFTGPNNIWSLYPGLVTQSAPFQAYNAIAAWT